MHFSHNLLNFVAKVQKTWTLMYKMKAITKLRERIESDYFDYTQLMEVLSNYKKPRDVVTSLLKKGDIIRIRKGFYIFSEFWRRQSLEPVALSNLIYGPSALSLDFALAWYGLIPERVEMFTSITPGRSRMYKSPIGSFSYAQLSLQRYRTGLTIHQNSTGNILMAEPLKALADKAWMDKRFKPTSSSSYGDYLFNDLRIDREMLGSYYNTEKLIDLDLAYQTRKISWLISFLNMQFREDNE